MTILYDAVQAVDVSLVVVCDVLASDLHGCCHESRVRRPLFRDDEQLGRDLCLEQLRLPPMLLDGCHDRSHHLRIPAHLLVAQVISVQGPGDRLERLCLRNHDRHDVVVVRVSVDADVVDDGTGLEFRLDLDSRSD